MFTVYSGGVRRYKKELKENSDEDDLNDLKIIRKLLNNSIEDEINDESDVIEQKNSRFFKEYH